MVAAEASVETAAGFKVLFEHSQQRDVSVAGWR